MTNRPEKPAANWKDTTGIPSVSVPYVGQARRFTCGPASLIMAMRALDPMLEVSEALEFELWREATTIHGGCGPLGLALAAHRRAFGARVWMSHDGVFAGDRAKDAAERETMAILQKRDRQEASERGIAVTIDTPPLEELATYLRDGAVPIVMVNIDFEGRNITHWTAVTDIDTAKVWVNDPLADGKVSQAHSTDRPLAIDHQRFESWRRFGQRAETGCLALWKAK
ncbi:MAG: peptidase C39 family protein [Phyllobacteriaceae bacterium]|jgi:SH3-like domain-containing protein|nr:peptidase C39 family protein [Phyllobacteriaceae bacterium]